MRVREFTAVIEDAHSSTMSATHDVNGSWVSWNASNYFDGVPNSRWEYCEDVVTPDYKRRAARGEIFNNPFLKKVRTILNPHAVNFSHRTTKYVNGKLVGYIWDGPYIPFAWTPDSKPSVLALSSIPGWSEFKAGLMAEATTQAAANIDASEMLALASAAESAKTMKYLQDTLKMAARIASKVRAATLTRGISKSLRKRLADSRTRKRAWKDLAKEFDSQALQDRYMEARYGLRPLAIDLAQILNTLEKQRRIFRRSFYGNSSGSVDHSDTLTSIPYFYETLVDVQRYVKYDVECRAGYLCDVDLHTADVAGAGKIAEAAWELLPMSFILNWFVDVASVIAAHTPNAGIYQRASWCTVKQTLTHTNTVVNCRSTAPSTWTAENSSSTGPATYGQSELVTERFVNPPLTLIPSVDIKLDLWKIADLAIIMKKIFL